MPLVSTLSSLKQVFVSTDTLCDAGPRHVFQGPCPSSDAWDQQWADESI